MALKTTEGITHDGRWHLVTLDESAPERFVSSVQLTGDMLDFDKAMGFGGQSYETITHDENGWCETPDGRNAEQMDSEAGCRAMHEVVVARFFGKQG